MNKNFYEILEVDRNASPEVIEKAYKTLAKKYHPDLQQDEEHKKQAENTLKLINEAYETLSNPTLKATYDEQLSNATISQETYNEMYKQNQELKNELNQLYHMQQHNTPQTQNPYHNHQSNAYMNQNQNSNMDFEKEQAQQSQRDLNYERQVQQARQQAYHDAYIQDLKNRGYKIRYKKTFSDRIKDFIALLIFIGILLLLLQLPFVRNFFMDIYNNNPLIQLFVNLFKN